MSQYFYSYCLSELFSIFSETLFLSYILFQLLNSLRWNSYFLWDEDPTIPVLGDRDSVSSWGGLSYQWNQFIMRFRLTTTKIFYIRWISRSMIISHRKSLNFYWWILFEHIWGQLFFSFFFSFFPSDYKPYWHQSELGLDPQWICGFSFWNYRMRGFSQFSFLSFYFSLWWTSNGRPEQNFLMPFTCCYLRVTNFFSSFIFFSF